MTIEAPADAVYAYLLDFTRHPEWCANLSRVTQLTPGPIGVGTRFHAVEWAPPVAVGRRLLSMVFFIAGLVTGADSHSEAEITALEPGQQIAWTGRVRRRKGDFNRSDWSITLEPSNGATRLRQHFAYFPQTAAARGMVASLDSARGIESAATANLARLKHVLERGVANGAPE